MYQCTKNPNDMTSHPCLRACPYYWQCVEKMMEARKEQRKEETSDKEKEDKAE